MRHTKGPWKVIKHSKGFEVFSKGEDVSVCEMSADDDQSLKNAHLIAAAPEMLEALTYALEIIEKKINVDDATLFRFEEIIKKARGES